MVNLKVSVAVLYTNHYLFSVQIHALEITGQLKKSLEIKLGRESTTMTVNSISYPALTTYSTSW